MFHWYHGLWWSCNMSAWACYFEVNWPRCLSQMRWCTIQILTNQFRSATRGTRQLRYQRLTASRPIGQRRRLQCKSASMVPRIGVPWIEKGSPREFVLVHSTAFRNLVSTCLTRTLACPYAQWSIDDWRRILCNSHESGKHESWSASISNLHQLSIPIRIFPVQGLGTCGITVTAIKSATFRIGMRTRPPRSACGLVPTRSVIILIELMEIFHTQHLDYLISYIPEAQ